MWSIIIITIAIVSIIIMASMSIVHYIHYHHHHHGYFQKVWLIFNIFKIISCILLWQGWGNTITDLFLHHRNQLSQLSGQISVLHGISDKLQRVEAILIGIGTWQEDFGAASLSPTAFDWRTAVRITFWWQFREYQVQCTLESTFQSKEEEIYQA